MPYGDTSGYAEDPWGGQNPFETGSDQLPYGYGSYEDPSNVDPSDWQTADGGPSDPYFDPSGDAAPADGSRAYSPDYANAQPKMGGGYGTTQRTVIDDFGNRWDLGPDGRYKNTDGKANYSMPAIGGQNTRQYLPETPQNGQGRPGNNYGYSNGPGTGPSRVNDPNGDTWMGDNGTLMQETPDGTVPFYGQQGQDPSVTAQGGIQEDDPGWNWRTMGNGMGSDQQGGSDFLFDPYTGQPLAGQGADLGTQQPEIPQQAPQRYLSAPAQAAHSGGGTTLSPDEIRALAEKAGFTGAGLDRVVQIAMAESGGDFSQNSTNEGGAAPGSVDRGLMQLNSYFNSDISDEDAADPWAAMQAAFRISKGGTDFSDWTTNGNGTADRQPTGGGGVRPDIGSLISQAPQWGQDTVGATTNAVPDLPQGEQAPQYNLNTGENISDLPEGLSSKAAAMGDYQNPDTAKRLLGASGKANVGTNDPSLWRRYLGAMMPASVGPAGGALKGGGPGGGRNQPAFRPDTRQRTEIPRVSGMRTDEIRAGSPSPWLNANGKPNRPVFTPAPSRMSSPFLSGIGNAARYTPPKFQADLRTRTPVPIVRGMRSDEMRQSSPAQWSQPRGSFFAGNAAKQRPQWAPDTRTREALPVVRGMRSDEMRASAPAQWGPAPQQQPVQWGQSPYAYTPPPVSDQQNAAAQANWDAWMAAPVAQRPAQAPAPAPRRRFDPAPSDRTYGGTSSTRMQ